MVKQNNYATTVRMVIDSMGKNNFNIEVINRTASVLLMLSNYIYSFQSKNKYNMFISNIVMQLVAAELAARALGLPVSPIAEASKIANEEAARIINSKK